MTAVPLYDYRCTAGHRFEAMAPLAASDTAACPCGASAVKVPSRVALAGQADPGRPMELMPQTWRGTYEGNREYLGQLRREWGARQKLEEKHEELRGDQRPILAHEGRYHGAPLRAGDPVPDHSHAHPHSHSHGHSHGTETTT
ncbi:FmdB family zinc ribbon protein [Geodermatophilus sp. URMC 64]